MAQCPGRCGIDRFENFGIDLGQHAAIGQTERQHAGRRAEAENADEKQCPDQFRNAAQEGQQAARYGVERRLFAPGTGREIAHRYGDQAGQRHAGRGDGQGFERCLGEVADELGPGFERQETRQEVADDLEVARIEQGAGFDGGRLKQWPENE